MALFESRNVDTPDEKHTFEHGEVQIVHLTGMTVGRASFRPGWRWSTDVKPIVGTSSCQLLHTSYVVSGRCRVRMDDGTERELGPGDAHVVAPGHDAWVVGDEPCVTIDFSPNANLLGGRVVHCPCGVEFRVDDDGEAQLDHLVAAVQAHAEASHGHVLTRERVLAEAGRGLRAERATSVDAAAAVRRVVEAYGDRLRADDVEGIVALFTADATVMVPDLPVATGAAEITELYTTALDASAMDHRFQFDAVDVEGTTATVRTHTTGTTTVRATSHATPARYRELFALRRSGDDWRIAQYMFQPQAVDA